MYVLYGMIWLVLLSPYTVFLSLGSMATYPMATPIEIIGVFGGCYFYWDVVWIPVRRKYLDWDQEFCKVMGWR